MLKVINMCVYKLDVYLTSYDTLIAKVSVAIDLFHGKFQMLLYSNKMHDMIVYQAIQ